MRDKATYNMVRLHVIQTIHNIIHIMQPKQIRYISNHGIKSVHESNSYILTWWMKHCPTMSRVSYKIPIDAVKIKLIFSENQFGLKNTKLGRFTKNLKLHTFESILC